MRIGKRPCVLVTPSAKRLSRLRCRCAGREIMLGLGAYPATTLKPAHKRADDARRLLQAGRTRPPRPEQPPRARWDVRGCRSRVIEKQPFAPLTRDKALWTLEDLRFEYRGRKAVRRLTAHAILEVLHRLEARGYT